jgi:hypothetical protein
MLHTLSWIAIGLLGVFFAVSGACMLLSPRMYFNWMGRLLPRSARMGEQQGTRWKMVQIWTRLRGAMLLGVMVWVAYQGFLKMKGL